jgi:hypothetical protein
MHLTSELEAGPCPSPFDAACIEFIIKAAFKYKMLYFDAILSCHIMHHVRPM